MLAPLQGLPLLNPLAMINLSSEVKVVLGLVAVYLFLLYTRRI
jgi:hypothetical protein